MKNTTKSTSQPAKFSLVCVLYLAVEGYLLGAILSNLISMVTIRSLDGFSSIVAFWVCDALAKVLAFCLAYAVTEWVMRSRLTLVQKRLILGGALLVSLAIVIGTMLSVILPSGSY